MHVLETWSAASKLATADEIKIIDGRTNYVLYT